MKFLLHNIWSISVQNLVVLCHEVGGAFLIIRMQILKIFGKLHVRAHLLYYAYGAAVEEWF